MLTWLSPHEHNHSRNCYQPPFCLDEMKPEVSVHMAKIVDGGTAQFWGIVSRDLGNRPKAPLEHTR